MASMEEMRQTAMTYYKTVPKHVKKLADEFFSAMDDNRDGKISLHEFAAFMSEQGYEAMNNQCFFNQINKNKSGNLDFEDVITLFYILKSGRPLCSGCRKLIEASYFTCVKCYCENKSFCLHPKCFEGGKYVHPGHAEFLDNYALLERQKGLMATPKSSKFSRFKALISGSSSSTSLEMVPASASNTVVTTSFGKKKAAFTALGTALVGSTVCTMM